MAAPCAVGQVYVLPPRENSAAAVRITLALFLVAKGRASWRETAKGSVPRSNGQGLT